MKSLVCSLLVLLCIISSSPGYATCPQALEETVLYNLNNKRASLSCVSHKVLVINLWATWCAPCRIEIPYLNEIYSQFGPLGVEVVGISLDSVKPGYLKQFVASYKIAYPVYINKSQDLLSKMDIIAIPATLIIDSSGNVSEKLIGLHVKDDIVARIKNVLAIEQGRH